MNVLQRSAGGSACGRRDGDRSIGDRDSYAVAMRGIGVEPFVVVSYWESRVGQDQRRLDQREPNDRRAAVAACERSVYPWLTTWPLSKHASTWRQRVGQSTGRSKCPEWRLLEVEPHTGENLRGHPVQTGPSMRDTDPVRAEAQESVGHDGRSRALAPGSVRRSRA